MRAASLKGNKMTDEKKQTGIFAAIAAAMGEVERVSKGGENKEQKYKFASVDDFLAMAGPICAKHGGQLFA